MMVARSVARDTASRFGINAFLIGTRANISTSIQRELSTQLEEDGMFFNIKRVSMQRIVVNQTYERSFQRVEDVELQRIAAAERPNLVRTNEARLNTTQFIAREAQRNQQLQVAVTETTQATLLQRQRVTEANTTFQNAMITAESNRSVSIINANTALGRIIASRPRLVSEVEREALANQTLAETERQNMVVRAEGNISRALANLTRDVAAARIRQTLRLERLISREINHTLDLFQIGLEANTSAAETEARGNATAAETLGERRADTADWIMLRVRRTVRAAGRRRRPPRAAAARGSAGSRSATCTVRRCPGRQTGR